MKYWRISGIVGILLLAALGFLYQAAPYMILSPRKFNLPETPADWGLPFEKINVMSADSLHLTGYWVHQAGDTGKTTILLLHGVGGCKEHWLPTATWLWQQGYETILMDARAHGESEGAYCTYGYFEKKDVAAVAAWLNQQHPGASLGVWGNSMGGAIALQALETVPQLRFGIVESTFADFRTIVFDYQRRRLRIPWSWFADSGIARAAEIAHFVPDSVRPAESARHIRQPVFLAHGDADTNIRVEYGRQIFANLASRQKELHIIPGANHYDVMARGGDAYRSAMLRFLAEHR